MTAYYNEIDPYAAQWLRSLISAGHIAPGVVDERSIADVQPGDLAAYDQCHFFAGIGGWSYALRLAGWSDDRPVWTGSCPCQPLSCAGQQKGHADARHLWPSFYGLIAECSPAIIFGEQVGGPDGREWLSAVRSDLEDSGYAVGAADLPACSQGAAHIRQRLFFLAHAHSARPTNHSGFALAETGIDQRPPFGVGCWTNRRDHDWTTEPPVGRVAHGLSRAMAAMCANQLKGFGNAIVPQVAATFIEAAMTLTSPVGTP